MNRLERTYRLLLTAYPPDYLADREEELVGTLLAAAPVGATRPPWREMVSLVRSGITERSRRFGAPTRRHGLAAASGVAAGALAASVTYHVGLQLTPTWSAAYPTAFFPYWTVLTLVAMAGHLARGRGRDSARVVLVLVGAVGMVAGPASVLAWRSAIAASVLFGLIATLRPDVSGWWPTLTAAALGVAVGVSGVHHQLGKIPGGPYPSRSAFFAILQIGIELRWLVPIVLGAAVVWAWVAPHLGLALGMNALPASLAALALDGPGQSRWDRAIGGVPVIVLVTTAGLAACALALASTLRARPRSRRLAR